MSCLSYAGIVLIVVNLGFVAAGAMLIKFASDMTGTGWLSALDETQYKAAAGTLVTFIECVGIAGIVLAMIGIVGAAARSRILLMVYAFLMVAAMLIYGVIGGTAFSFSDTMTRWRTMAFPADTTESDFAAKFNQIYCYAQGAYFCNSANTADLVSIFLPTLSSEAAAMLPEVTGLNSLCASDEVSSITGIDSVCKACGQAAKYAKFDKILTWANEKCPRTATTSTWCAAYLESGTLGEVYVNSPYKQCRPNFLTVAISWGTSLATYGALAFVATAVSVALSCFARRSRHTDDNKFGHRQYKA